MITGRCEKGDCLWADLEAAEDLPRIDHQVVEHIGQDQLVELAKEAVVYRIHDRQAAVQVLVQAIVDQVDGLITVVRVGDMVDLHMEDMVHRHHRLIIDIAMEVDQEEVILVVLVEAVPLLSGVLLHY